MKYPIYRLSPAQFELLCLDLFVAEGWNVRIPENNSKWDIIGEMPDEDGTQTSVAIEVKHRQGFISDLIPDFVSRASKSGAAFENYLLVTSGNFDVDQGTYRAIENITIAYASLPVRWITYSDVLKLIERHPEVSEKRFKDVAKKQRGEVSMFAASLAVVIAVGATMASQFVSIQRPREESGVFERQIRAVEANLNSLKSLEKNLNAIKSELKATSEDSLRIKAEYEQALKLKEITSEQLEQVRKAVNSQSKFETAMNYLWGFALGVAGSILATIITEKWKRWRALSGK